MRGDSDEKIDCCIGLVVIAALLMVVAGCAGTPQKETLQAEKRAGREFQSIEAVPKLQFLAQLLTPGENCLQLIPYTTRN
jgi:hypothetical protein